MIRDLKAGVGPPSPGMVRITGRVGDFYPYRIGADPDEVVTTWGFPGPARPDLLADDRRDDSDLPMGPLPGSDADDPPGGQSR